MSYPAHLSTWPTHEWFCVADETWKLYDDEATRLEIWFERGRRLHAPKMKTKDTYRGPLLSFRDLLDFYCSEFYEKAVDLGFSGSLLEWISAVKKAGGRK